MSALTTNREWNLEQYREHYASVVRIAKQHIQRCSVLDEELREARARLHKYKAVVDDARKVFAAEHDLQYREWRNLKASLEALRSRRRLQHRGREDSGVSAPTPEEVARLVEDALLQCHNDEAGGCFGPQSMRCLMCNLADALEALNAERTRAFAEERAGNDEADELLRDIDDFLCDEPHPEDGGRWSVLELRQRIRARLTHDTRPAAPPWPSVPDEQEAQTS